MTIIIGIMIMTAVFGYMAWFVSADGIFEKKSKKSYITAVLVIGFLARVIFAASYRGHATDMNCFQGWADAAFKDGLTRFYLSDSFHDYPPGYVYVLYCLGAVKNIFKLNGPLLWVVLKLPSILADLAMGYVAYKATLKKFSAPGASVIAAVLVFNPTVILNSSVWGQVDSILALACVVSIYLASEKKWCGSFFAFAAAILIKPQAVFFAPILLFGVIDELFVVNSFDKNKFIKMLLYAIGAIAAMFVLFMPFGISIILDQYIKTIGQYNYMTVNAFNLYGMLGLNWSDLTTVVSVIGYVFIAAAVGFSAYIFFKNRDGERYWLASFVLVFAVYMLSAKMHERYAFPGIFMLIMLLASAPTNKNYTLYGLFSLSQFFNIAWVLLVYETEPGVYFKSPVVAIASLINVIFFVWVILSAVKRNSVQKSVKKKAKAEVKQFNRMFRLSEKMVRITAFDIAAILIISAVYSVTAFYKLGNSSAPQTGAELTRNGVTVDLGKEHQIADTAFYLGARELSSDRSVILTYLDNNGKSVYNDIIEDGSVFSWSVRENESVRARYVTVSSETEENADDFSDRVYLNELCFLDGTGDIINPINADSKDISVLFDEQDFLDMTDSYMSGTYFDEIYHPRTAYEFLNHMSVYEWTHPPLGKVLMGIGISIFGMVPFGWRFIGTLLGVLMIPIVYIFAKQCFKNKWIAVLGCVLYTFDFMHFTQTRLATIDTYVTLFIILMYYYMYKYYKQSFYDTPLYKTLIPLGISGIFFGCSVASKWTGLYAGAGLAAIFFITLFERYREYKYACLDPDGITDGISHKKVTEQFKRNTVITLVFCCVMFVAVPILIYTLSYIPYMMTPSGEGIKTILTNAESMLTYHGKTVVDSTHPYSSYWFEWPIMYKPIWYYSNTLENGLKEGISAFGNPSVWWVGIGAVAYCMAHAIIIPLKNCNYFGKNKYLFSVAYAAIFAILCVVAGGCVSGNENLQRLLPCMLLYSTVFIAIFIVVMMYDDIIRQTSNRVPLFMLIGYFSSYMPWMLVLRTTYIYHYFPCVIFVVLMIAYSIKSIYDNADNKKAVIISAVIYAIIAVGLFVLFYPVISGQPITLGFAEQYLKWFKSWVLVA